MSLSRPKTHRMYDELAAVWSKLSPAADYAEEAAVWRDTLFELVKLPPGRTRPRVLDLGVGGGNNLSHLTSHVDAVAVDIAPRMLDVSRKLNPGVRHVEGDMRDIRLGEKFDAVLMHDAISYMLTEDDLGHAFATARAHLAPGGIVIAGPDWIRGRSTLPVLSHRQGETGEPSYAEFVHDPDPDDAQIELIFSLFLPQDDGSVKVVIDRHEHGFFRLETWFQIMEEAGFTTVTRTYGASEYLPGLLLTGAAL